MQNKNIYIVLIILISLSINIYSFIEINYLKEENNSLYKINTNFQKQLKLLSTKYENKMETNNKLAIEEFLKLQKGQQKQLSKLKIEKNKQKLSLPILELVQGNYSFNSLNEQLENMSDDELSFTLKKFLNFKDKDLPNGLNIRKFIEKLLKISIANGIDEDVIIAENLKVVKFDSKIDKTDIDFETSDDKQTIKSNTKKIFLGFDMKGYDDKKVLVKWYHKDTNEIVLYDLYRIRQNKTNYIIAQQKNKDWDTGEYIAEIYSVSENLKLISTSTLTIEK